MLPSDLNPIKNIWKMLEEFIPIASNVTVNKITDFINRRVFETGP